MAATGIATGDTMASEVIKKIDIEGLHKVGEAELPELFNTFCRAFGPYPKLDRAFPDPKQKALAVEMVVEFYGHFDITFGNIYSSDSSINDGIVVLHSDEVNYSQERLLSAGCESDRFKDLAERLGSEGFRRWNDFFDELDKNERLLSFPETFIYVDFLAVDPAFQGSGRGSSLIKAVCNRACELGLPVMLFTNGDDDVRFYEKQGFKVIGITQSERVGLYNTYMLYDIDAPFNS